MIRQAVAADIPGITACAEAAYRPYIVAIGRAPAPMVADFARQVADGEVHVAVADDDALQSFIVFRRKVDHMLLENVAVQPAAIGQGIGKALIHLCEAAASSAGLRAIHLYTNEKMTRNFAHHV